MTRDYHNPGMTDHLIAVCKLCGHTVRISLEHGGRRAKCPKCEGIIEIPRGETSVRLRSDRELTREARAKAGRGPDSDPDTPAPGPGTRHGTARIRRVPHKTSSPARSWTLIATLVATVAVIAGIVLILFKGSPKDASKAAPPPAASPVAPKKTPPPGPPPPPVKETDPREDMIKTRLYTWVNVFNRNDMTRLTEYYTSDVSVLTRAFGNILTDSELRYEGVKVKSVEFPDPDIKTTIVFTRIRKYADGGREDKQEAVERVLVWTKKDDKWVISTPPEP